MKTESKLRHLALDENGKLIDVKNVTDRTKRYLCPHCKNEVIAKMGDVRQWHFAHKVNTDKCKYSNYLHTIAEIIICEWFNSVSEVPLMLNYNEKCEHFDTCPLKTMNFCTKVQQRKINLKKWIASCSREQTFVKNGEEFRADIMCHNKCNEDVPVFIEVYVNHKCEQKKINSGIKIIEFKIENEEDIKRIITSPIQESDNTFFYNFKPKDEIGSWKDFSMPMKRFTLFKSLKAHLDDLTCHDFERRRGIFELTINMTSEEEDIPVQVNGEFLSPRTSLFSLGFILARKHFPGARHCNICKWHATTMYGEHICKLFKKYNTQRNCAQNDPIICPYFQVSSDIQRGLEEMYCKFSQNHYIDVWKINNAVQ